jgi:hypothetical protein
MASTLNKTGIIDGSTVEAYHVTQSIDAFTGIKEYDISLSGSFNVTGSTLLSGPLPNLGNTAIGKFALNSIVLGVNNTAIGSFALCCNLTGSNNIAIGYNALFSNLANSNIAIGNVALQANTTGYFIR